jgi:hypothetical protein
MLGILIIPLTARALTLGQIDDFQDGTSQNWGVGVGPVTNVASGGPAGAGDRYIQATSLGGSGPQSRMVILNSSQWLGDYVGAGITAIAMDLNNFSSQPLSMRLAFFVNSSSGYASTTPFSLAANSGWEHTSFSLNPADFTAIGSPGDFNTLLSNFNGQLRILSSTSPSLRGDSIAATLGVDNVQAIPESGTFVMVGVGMLILFGLRQQPRSENRVINQSR